MLMHRGMLKIGSPDEALPESSSTATTIPMPIILKSTSKPEYMLLISYSQQLAQSYKALENIL